MFFLVTRPKHCPGSVQSSLNMLVKCSYFLTAMSTSQISKHLPHIWHQWVPEKKNEVRRREAINFTKQPLMEDDNDDYENECDEKYIFYLSTMC